MLVDNITKMGRSRRNAFSASLIVIATFATYNWMVKPHALRLSSAKAYKSTVDTVAQKSRALTAAIGIKRKKLEQLRGQSEELLSTLFTPDQATEFFSDIEIISGQTGCAVRGITLISDEKDSEYERLGIRRRRAELNVVGFFRDVVMLMGRLQRRSQKVWLDTVELQNIDHSSDKVACKLTITICEIGARGTS